MMREYCVLGMMSGTSMDGVDAAILVTDGQRISNFGPIKAIKYDNKTRALLRQAMVAGQDLKDPSDLPPLIIEAGKAITEAHLRLIADIKPEAARQDLRIELIGFHGQTIVHRPKLGWSLQVGDPARIAAIAEIDVVGDFRSNDLRMGGEGAPLAPLYHQALVHVLDERGAVSRNQAIVFLNVGGIANVTWVSGDRETVIAFDTGPGNALLDDWVGGHGAGVCDLDGQLALQGRVSGSVLSMMMANPYFKRRPPKSLDRADFDAASVAHLSLEDGAATLTAFTAESIRHGLKQITTMPDLVLVCGGGRHNPALLAALRQRLQTTVEPVEEWGLRGDFLEAEAFAYLAVRSRCQLPLSLPTTTGCRAAASGGDFHEFKPALA